MEEYLKTNGVFPLMIINNMGVKSGYYYRFFPEFTKTLLNSPMNVVEPSDLIANCEKKFKALKYIGELPKEKEEEIVIDNENDAIELWGWLWCRTLASQDVQEQNYRLTQLVKVLTQYKAKDNSRRLELYRDIISICNKVGSGRLAVTFFTNIKSTRLMENVL